MKILVTGGAGFIGSNLCEALHKDPNNEVMSLDNYSTGSMNNHIFGVNYIRADTASLSHEHFTFKPDIVYHLGEYSRVEQSFADFQTVWESNIIGTRQVLEYVRNVGCKLVYAGSSTKFGDIGPNSSPYAWSKSNNTQLVKNYAEWFGINYAITYFYNVYGNREIEDGPYSTLIAKFAKKHKLGEKLTVTLPGTRIRNFTHVEDTVKGLMLVGEKGYGDEYGIGSDDSYSVNQIAEMFGGGIVYSPPVKGNRLEAKVVSHKTKGLGWAPTKSVEEYIKSII